LCREHYNVTRRKGVSSDDPTKRGQLYRRFDLDGNPIPCNDPDCAAPRYAGGYCNRHYQRIRDGRIGLSVSCPVPGCTTRIRPTTPLCKAHYRLAWRYKLTASDVVDLLTNPVCSNPGCDETDNLHIDHDHSCCDNEQGQTCGKCVRGLLCPGCNKALGLVHENPRRLQGLVAYLSAHEATT
jgi:hypothetical protein